jgi:hypothetical protein
MKTTTGSASAVSMSGTNTLGENFVFSNKDDEGIEDLLKKQTVLGRARTVSLL